MPSQVPRAFPVLAALLLADRGAHFPVGARELARSRAFVFGAGRKAEGEGRGGVAGPDLFPFNGGTF